LRGVGGPFADRGEGAGTGDDRGRGDEQDRYEAVPHPTTSTWVTSGSGFPSFMVRTCGWVVGAFVCDDTMTMKPPDAGVSWASVHDEAAVWSSW
jgi:hypothetical protein